MHKLSHCLQILTFLIFKKNFFLYSCKLMNSIWLKKLDMIEIFYPKIALRLLLHTIIDLRLYIFQIF